MDPKGFNNHMYSVPQTRSGKSVRSSRAERMSEFIADKEAPYCLVRYKNQIVVDDSTHKLIMQEKLKLQKQLGIIE
jgi:hypothetical protein